jgi:phosphopantetheine adenylyltransferase
MVTSDEYNVPMIIHHWEADAMAGLLRQQRADLLVIGLRKVQDAVDEVKTDHPTEWRT